MSDMVEKVARVLYEKNHPRDSSWSPWEALNPSEIGCYTDLARAAIEAMREPTEEMIRAEQNWAPGEYDEPGCITRSIIDAALSTKGEG